MTTTTTINENVFPTDANTFALYFNKNRNKMYFAAYKILKDKLLADDAVANTYIKAVEKQEKFNGTCKLSTWLVSICINLSLDMNKRESKSVSISEEILPVSLHVEPSVQNFDMKKAVRAAICDLSETHQTMVNKRFFEGKQFNEIASEMGIPEGTVKVTVSRILTKLAPKLAAFR